MRRLGLILLVVIFAGVAAETLLAGLRSGTFTPLGPLPEGAELTAAVPSEGSGPDGDL